MKTLQERTLEAIECGHSVAKLADAAKVSSAAVSQWKSGGTKKLKGESAAGLEALTGWSATWWATGKGPKLATPVVAHEESHPQVTTPPITPWGDIVSLEKTPAIPADLMVEVPDEALANRDIRKGQFIWFKAANTAEPADVVLIEANGRRYIRRYTESGRAEATDTAYVSFDGNFKIVAVMFMLQRSKA